MSATRRTAPERTRIALPLAHLLALAPLDIWVRMIARSSGVGVRYWPRLVGIFITSAIGTLCTLPERAALGIIDRVRPRTVFDHAPGVVVIVGYYRSGTTHLQNLIACDPGVVTPTWDRVLMAPGWRVSWGIARVMLVPFMGTHRPQDGVGFGPDWPGEDDFALAGWGDCSTLPGRLIFPDDRERWARWSDPGSWTGAQRKRWRSMMARFSAKVARKGKILVLKTPTHGAVIPELRAVFGDRLRIVHALREPTEVIESNMRLHASLARHRLQDGPGPGELRARIVEEYGRIERATRAHLVDDPSIPRVGVLHSDTISDPIGQLERVYGALGLGFSDRARKRVLGYLGELGAYRNTKGARAGSGPAHGEEEVVGELRSALPEPVFSRASPPPVPQRVERPVLGACAGVGIMVACALVWVGLVWVIKEGLGYPTRIDQFVWVTGALVGLWARRVSGRGSFGMGAVCVALTVCAMVVVSFPITVIGWNHGAGYGFDEWLKHNTLGAVSGMTALSSVSFTVLGCVSAWKHSGTRGPNPPGIG